MNGDHCLVGLADGLSSLPLPICDASPLHGVDVDNLAAIAEALDGMGLAVCAFDQDNRTLFWNRRFLLFFPEHAGHVHRGEPYAANLRRFYEGRLEADERAQIDRYIAEGITRHELQSRPYTFWHNERHLRVACAVLPGQLRVRMWQNLAEAGRPSASVQPTTLQRLAQHHADGFVILDASGRVASANDEFLRLYDLFSIDDAAGLTLTEIVDRAWSKRGGRRSDALLDNSRFTGAPFEIELPDERWRRVVEHRSSDGADYSTHNDITVPKRLHRELTEAREALRARNAELLVLAGTDPLTGIANRRVFDALLREAWAQARQSGEWLALLLIDVDHFKAINDRYGHPMGDLCLRQIAAAIGTRVRTSRATVARFGGEEFAVILPDTDPGSAVAVAERIRTGVAASPLLAPPDVLSATVSIGVACVRPSDPAGAYSLIEMADRFLYVAKRGGRNRTVSGAD